MTKAQVGELLKSAEQTLHAATALLKAHKKNEPLPSEWSRDLAQTIQALQRASRWDGRDQETNGGDQDQGAAGGAKQRGRKSPATDETDE